MTAQGSLIDLTGQRFGRLIVTGRAPNSPTLPGAPRWWCLCDCGRAKSVSGMNLRYGVTKSCGCLARGETATVIKHGLVRSDEYLIWQGMKRRCENPRARNYAHYGGRGIKVCEEWRHDFAAFYAHIGPRPGPGYSLDRIDVNGHYEPGNVRWATAAQQVQNRRPRAAYSAVGATGMAAAR